MFEIKIELDAENFLKKLDKKQAEFILKKIYEIKHNPFRYLKRLKGHKLYRLRISEYRVILDVVVSKNKIVVLKIGHRKNVYDLK